VAILNGITTSMALEDITNGEWGKAMQIAGFLLWLRESGTPCPATDDGIEDTVMAYLAYEREEIRKRYMKPKKRARKKATK
jgi:hypothetical protein